MSHHWSPSYSVEVVEKAFGVVDGWTQKRVWFTPLTIQIFAVQVAAISGETNKNTNTCTVINFKEPGVRVNL